MEFNTEIYKLLLAWLIAYSIIAPVIVLVNYVLSFYFGTKTIFDLHRSTSPFLIISSEFTYMTFAFLKTMWAYKHILHKKKYYPETNEEFKQFILLYIGIHIIIDILWAIFVNTATSKIHFLKFLNNYTHELGIYSLLRPLIIGIVLVLFTNVVIQHIGDIEGIGAVMFSIFVLQMASY